MFSKSPLSKLDFDLTPIFIMTAETSRQMLDSVHT